MTESATKKQTKYPKRAHLMLCSSQVSCNNPDKGRATFDPDALKARWRREGYSKVCFLQITACMGMCDLGNSGCLITPERTFWLGGLTSEHHNALMTWLVVCKALPDGAPLPPLPEIVAAQEVGRLVE